ncbi:MAG: type II toxin-antitoxin system VapC family toxin [Acidobacteria bacterium]|nr:type II toxin-antitoxin system VapC family toxin [Acidobacteriota bacterium]MYE45013.1 type II toxin-antitoxin system VapC family toxin [Acidobacteriota bacterium]
MDGDRPVTAVVDTNVVAYLLLGTEEFVEESQAFIGSLDGGMAPAVWEAELANVVWMAVRQGVIPLEEGGKRLSAAARLGIQSVSNRSLWHGALVRGVQSGIAAYDALFVELAIRESLPLATFDQALLVTFPGVAYRPGALA